MTNEALREAGLTARVDHRSYKDQGIDREPQPLIPNEILYSERWSGRSNPAGDDIRARHRERVEARAQGAEALARVIERQKREGRERAIQSSARKDGAKKIPQGALTREQLNSRQREWRKEHAEEVNRKQTERRRANRDEVNRKQREYLRKRTALRKAEKNLSSSQERLPTKAKGRAPVQSATSAPRPSTPASAEESVKNWLAFRAQRNPAPDQDSLANWLAYRESQAKAGVAESSPQDRSRDPQATGTVHRDGAPADSDGKRSRKNDLGY